MTYFVLSTRQDQDSSVKEEEEAQLAHIEGLLAKYDSDFVATLVGDAQTNIVVDEQTIYQLQLV